MGRAPQILLWEYVFVNTRIKWNGMGYN